ncbi:glycosyltransferase family 2 protein [Hyphomonas pacifica]|uniref:glycosyltransferase family 2 protein n=1 Tax=Hyphomonas pacifica TaxID=1280941 RepID=UPI000DBF6772|nr:glycosyltransferase family 2 protein [Hyphomonas pacifica]RAN36843.1 hypothetical protein HY11_11415 [Hyphomonas pacifica]
MIIVPTITAIVVSYHTGPRLHECLYALKSDPSIAEVIIVDNGNPPEDEAWLDSFSCDVDKVHIIRDGTNPGFGAAVNKGVAGALGELLLIINPDAVLRRGSLPVMYEAMKDRPQPVLVGGKIFDIHGREERGGRRKTLTLMRAIGIGKWTLENDPPPEDAIEVGAVSGAFFMMDRKAFRGMGGFDEGYFLHVEDVDLCRRVLQQGGSVVYEPRAGVLHYGSTSDVPSETVLAHKADSLTRYFRKFASGPLERAMVALVSPLFIRILKARS